MELRAGITVESDPEMQSSRVRTHWYTMAKACSSLMGARKLRVICSSDRHSIDSADGSKHRIAALILRAMAMYS